MVAVVGARFRQSSTRLWKQNCRQAARNAGGNWWRPGSRTSIKPKYRNPAWSGSSFTFTWGGVSAADGGCRAAAVLENAFGLRVSRGGLAQAFERVAKKAEPTYEKLVERIRGSPSVTPDETGWKVGGQLWWMWAFSSAAVTVYSIQPGRGFEQAAVVLGTEYDGFLVRDGWIVYRGFSQAIHQTCLAHLLRRCREMMAVAR
ncbi:MAG: transposase, partial [Candidatus Acidiferrum sp.]